MVIKFDLMMLYKCYRHENTSKESQQYIFENYIYIYVRPLPADSGHHPDRKNHENHQKIEKKRDFSKIDILLYSGRKCDIWPEIDPLDPGKSLESLY